MNKRTIRTLMFLIVFIGALITYKTVTAENTIYCNDYQEIKDFAKCEVQKHWQTDEWSAFEWIIEQESRWDYQADNPHSSAYGLPQALTSLHKLPTDYMTNPQSQILWAINYIDGRYGSPQKAMEYWKRNKSY